MNVKKTIKRLMALGTGATMIGATIAGALAYDLADYPSPFVKDGVVDTLIVIGAAAKPMDTLGAIDIAASVQAAAKTPVAVGGATGGVTLTGDNVAISRSSNLLEVNQFLGDVRKTLTEADLKALAGGTMTTGGHSTKYNQYLRLNFTDAATTAQGRNSGRVVYERDTKSKITGDFLYFQGNVYMWEYQLEFSDGLESDVDSSANLDDLEDEALNIFGTDYTIVDTTTASTSNTLTLKLMGGDVSDTLGEGETKTYTLNGVDYEVTAVFISDVAPTKAKFSVNGELTKELADSDTDILSNGIEIGIRSILTNQREGIVEFFLGANKLELTDTNFSDDSFSSGVKIGGETIEDAEIKIKASYITGSNYPDSGEKLAINSVYYQLKADASSGSDIYIPPGHGLKEYLDESAGMLNPTWDIKYEGLMDVETTPIKFDPSGDDAYFLEFTNNEGLVYSVPFVDNSGSLFWFGSDTEHLFAMETNITNRSAYRIAENDYFIVTDRNDDQGITHILQFDSVDETNKQILLDDLATGSKTVTYSAASTNLTQNGGWESCTGAYGNLIVGGATFRVYVCGDAGIGYNLSVDHDGDGTVTFKKRVNIVTQGGALLNLTGNLSYAQLHSGNITEGDGFNVSLTVPQRLFDENGPYNTTGGLQASTDMRNNIQIIKRTSNQIGISVDSTQYLALKSDQANNDYQYALSPFGDFWTYYNPPGTTEAESLTIDFPKQQRGVQVFVTAGPITTTKTTASGDTQAYTINQASVGIAVMDTDVQLGQGNMIVVGGPCVNTIAMELMENPAICAEGFEPGKAVIKLYADKNALLVAGYDWQDTLGASYVLAQYADYKLSGTEMEVVVADLDHITVNKVE
ncbi:MAG: S-layer protein [Nanoarchaeota archaeon]